MSERPELNVTDGELLRIRNMCEGQEGDVRIWAFMLQSMVDYIRAVRVSAPSSQAEIERLKSALETVKGYWRGQYFDGITHQDREKIEGAFAALSGSKE